MGVEYWIVSNETNTDVRMYNFINHMWKVLEYVDEVTLLYNLEVRY